MQGRHQDDNCALALAAFQTAGLKLNQEEITHAISNAFWPGRTEVLAQSPLVLVDGAHNPAGVLTLTQTMMGPLEFPVTDWILVVGFSQGHDPQSWAAAWPQECQPKTVWVIPPNMPRAMPLKETLERLQPVWPHATAGPDLPAALARVRADKIQERGVCLAGSLYLVGEARAHWFEEPVDPQFPLF